MRCRCLVALVGVFVVVSTAPAYVEVPHSLGQCVKESTTIVLVEVTKVEKTKNLIIYKKVQDLKGKHPKDEIKHNIGQRGFHAREWQNVMAWAEVGKKAVFFHNGGASETCIGNYWYQAYPEGEWWGMSHAEPFLLRTYMGDPEKLAAAVTAILAGKEVIITCLADGNKNELHLRKGKVQRLKASLARGNYDAKRDFVGWGGDGDDDIIIEYKEITLLAASAADWKYLPEKDVSGKPWQTPEFDDKAWRTGKAPIGYGEEEIKKREGTTIPEVGVPFVFRRAVDVPSDVLQQKNVTIRLSVASDDSATVYLNGKMIDDEQTDHEFAYWNRDIELKPEQFKAGKNVIAAVVRNKQGSSDLYFDLEVVAQIPLPPKKPVKPTTPNTTTPSTPSNTSDNPLAMQERPGVLTVDRAKRTVTVECTVAPRKLAHLNEIYPIEVIATYPHPLGQKAHETVVNFTGMKPGSLQKAIAELGVKAGKPARGEGAKAEGPEVKLSLEFTGTDGKPQRVPVEQLLVDSRSGKPLPPITWHFTGSALKQPDPEKDDKIAGADLTGTLISIFPVTDDTVIQSSLTLKEEAVLKLQVVKDVLPKEGSPVKLVIEVK